MPSSKAECSVSADQITPSGLSGKTPTKIIVARHGSTVAFEFTFSGGSSFAKVRDNGRVEMGGTLEWGTGTEVVF